MRAAVPLLLLALLAPAAARAAPTERLAILVAHPEGGPDTEPLRYPHVDALKMGAVLTELGGFGPDDLTLLISPSPDEVIASLADVRARVDAARARGARTLLLFYYSGHAAAGDLRLGEGRLPMRDLRAGLQRSGADVQLAFLDACESGAMTRLKGGRRAPSFVVDVEPDRDASGYVVITSSSALEASQESDELRGSFFTHHLVSGLRGAADRTGDGAVSLEEAYAYAYHRTVAQTAGTRGGTQHPTFTYDLRGNGAVTLTRLGGRGALLFPPAGEGRYLVYDRGRDLVVGEVDKRAGTPARLSVAPGRYVVKKREANHLLLQEVTVGAAEQRALDDGAFEAVAFEDDVTKGPTWLAQRRRLGRGWLIDARVGYQAYFDAPAAATCSTPRPSSAPTSKAATWSRPASACTPTRPSAAPRPSSRPAPTPRICPSTSSSSSAAWASASTGGSPTPPACAPARSSRPSTCAATSATAPCPSRTCSPSRRAPPWAPTGGWAT